MSCSAPRWSGINTVVEKLLRSPIRTTQREGKIFYRHICMKKKKSHYHKQPKPVQPHLRVRLQSCFFDITYIFLNKECYLNRKRVAKSYCILYTCKCIFYIFASICVQVCSIFLLFRGGWEVWARLGIVSLFTCVINSISFERYKTNLVPSFLPALSGSTCIISLANHYNTSVDAAIVRRLWRDDQVECMREECGVVCRKMSLSFSWFCLVPGWLGVKGRQVFFFLCHLPSCS